MIDITEVHKLEEAQIEKRIEAERTEQLNNLEYYENQRLNNIKLCEEGKREAEKRLPILLKVVEEYIKHAISRTRRDTTVDCRGSIDSRNCANSYETMHMQIMLISVLSLQGFLCSICENDVKITW